MGSRCLENLPNVSDLRKIYVVWTLLPHYVSQKIIKLSTYISTEIIPVEIDKNGHSYPARLCILPYLHNYEHINFKHRVFQCIKTNLRSGLR